MWKVDIKGEPLSDTWEITVVKEGNNLGFESYGWTDENKLYIGGSGGPCREMVSEYVFNKLVDLAEDVADRLNTGDNSLIPIAAINP